MTEGSCIVAPPMRMSIGLSTAITNVRPSRLRFHWKVVTAPRIYSYPDIPKVIPGIDFKFSPFLVSSTNGPI